MNLERRGEEGVEEEVCQREPDVKWQKGNSLFLVVSVGTVTTVIGGCVSTTVVAGSVCQGSSISTICTISAQRAIR